MEIAELGKGAFGTVYKVREKMTDQLYAVKKVRLHLPLTEDLRSEIKNHKVYREVMALASLSAHQLRNTIRYFVSWFEEIDGAEKEEEREKLNKYKRRRLSSVSENKEEQSNDSDHSDTSSNFVQRSKSKSVEYYDSESES